MSEHYKYRYSITIETSDEVILQCLRAICNYSQTRGNQRIAWGGTGKYDWSRNGNQVTFHFSEPRYREVFKHEANRVLPTDAWYIVGENDNDPALPAR